MQIDYRDRVIKLSLVRDPIPMSIIALLLRMELINASIFVPQFQLLGTLQCGSTHRNYTHSVYIRVGVVHISPAENSTFRNSLWRIHFQHSVRPTTSFHCITWKAQLIPVCRSQPFK